jgi:hypothetical protein
VCDPDVVAIGGDRCRARDLEHRDELAVRAGAVRGQRRAIEDFLQRTYQLVATGQESSYLDFDAELTELLSQA